jgi:hypothetical protein
LAYTSGDGEISNTKSGLNINEYSRLNKIMQEFDRIKQWGIILKDLTKNTERYSISDFDLPE